MPDVETQRERHRQYLSLTEQLFARLGSPLSSTKVLDGIGRRGERQELKQQNLFLSAHHN